MPQLDLTTSFQGVSNLGTPRQIFLAGAPPGTIVAIEAGVSSSATEGVEVARLAAPNPSVSTGVGTTVMYEGSAQFLRYRVLEGSNPPGTAIWATGGDTDVTRLLSSIEANSARTSLNSVGYRGMDRPVSGAAIDPPAALLHVTSLGGGTQVLVRTLDEAHAETSVLITVDGPTVVQGPILMVTEVDIPLSGMLIAWSTP